MELKPQQTTEAAEMNNDVAEKDANALLEQVAEKTEQSGIQHLPDALIKKASPPKLKKLLEERPDLFSFFQVMRLLRSGHFVDESGAPMKVRIKPALKLSFQRSQVESVTFPSDNSEINYVEVTTNLPGLYGTGSPLPTFYTEELIEQEVDDKRTTKDVFDILNHRLYELLHAGRNKYRLMERSLEDGDDRFVNHLFGLIGLREKEVKALFPESRRLVRYLGLFSLKNRPASGLQALLSDLLDGPAVRVVQAVEYTGRIPEDQRSMLGSTMCLGQEANIGQEFVTSSGAITIEIGPVSRNEYYRFFPGKEEYQRVVGITRLYLSAPVNFNIEIILEKEKHLHGVQLGGDQGGSMGMDFWLGESEKKDGEQGERRVSLTPH